MRADNSVVGGGGASEDEPGGDHCAEGMECLYPAPCTPGGDHCAEGIAEGMEARGWLGPRRSDVEPAPCTLYPGSDVEPDSDERRALAGSRELVRRALAG